MAPPPEPSRTLVVPPRGRALILSDLHGHVADWEAFLAASRALERLAAGEDLWLVITGDVPDVLRHRQVDPAVPEDGDVRILDALLAARASLGERAGRIVYLEGNHDFHVRRIAREVLALARGEGARPGEHYTPGDLAAYFARYRRLHGEALFENNVVPYDMVPRARPEHLELIGGGPIVAVLEGAGVVVTHAGPPRVGGRDGAELRRTIDGARPEQLSGVSRDDYYESPYHQLLNNRFRLGDYRLEDVDRFLGLYEAHLLVTGHTPHPYLVDQAARAPWSGCSFRGGLGLIGPRQVVLCSSYGAFSAAHKCYLELDLTRSYRDVDALFEEPAVRPLYPSGAASARPIFPGLDLPEPAPAG